MVHRPVQTLCTKRLPKKAPSAPSPRASKKRGAAQQHQNSMRKRGMKALPARVLRHLPVPAAPQLRRRPGGRVLRFPPALRCQPPICPSARARPNQDTHPRSRPGSGARGRARSGRARANDRHAARRRGAAADRSLEAEGDRSAVADKIKTDKESVKRKMRKTHAGR